MHHTAISVITVIMVSNSDRTLQHGERSAALQPKHFQLHSQPFGRTSCTVKKLFPKLIFAVSPFLNYSPPLIIHIFTLVIYTPTPPQKKTTTEHPKTLISSFDPLSSLSPRAAWATYTLRGSEDVRVSEVPVTLVTSSPSCEDTRWWEVSFPN